MTTFTQAELLNFMLTIGRALAIFIIGLVLARMVRQWILRLGVNRRIAVNLSALLGNLVQILIIGLALVFILPSFGVDWTGILTVVGTVGLGLSLAFQDLLKNIIAGVYLLIERPFQIGDVITVERGTPVTGTVQAIELRVTMLRTADGLQLVVPNGVIFNEVLTNRTAFNLQRDVISVCVTPGDRTLSNLTSMIGDALRTVPQISVSPAPSTRVENSSPSQLRLHVEFWSAPAAEAVATEAAVLALRQTFPDADVTVVS
jgi:small-conductance mechanosensitive channel